MKFTKHVLLFSCKSHAFVFLIWSIKLLKMRISFPNNLYNPQNIVLKWFNLSVSKAGTSEVYFQFPFCYVLFLGLLWVIWRSLPLYTIQHLCHLSHNIKVLWMYLGYIILGIWGYLHNDIRQNFRGYLHNDIWQNKAREEIMLVSSLYKSLSAQ